MPPVKRRYILFKINPIYVDRMDGQPKKNQKKLDQSQQQKPLWNEGDIVNTIKDNVKKLHGDFGLASILFNFHLKKFDSNTRTGVLVVKRESYQFVLTTLPLIKSIKNHPITINVLKLTGTLRGSLRTLQGYHGRMIFEYKKILVEKQQESAKFKRKLVSSIDE